MVSRFLARMALPMLWQLSHSATVGTVAVETLVFRWSMRYHPRTCPSSYGFSNGYLGPTTSGPLPTFSEDADLPAGTVI